MKAVTDTTYESVGDYSSVSIKDRLFQFVKNPFSSFDISKKNVNPSDNADEQQTCTADHLSSYIS